MVLDCRKVYIYKTGFLIPSCISCRPWLFYYITKKGELPMAVGLGNVLTTVNGVMYTWFIDSDNNKIDTGLYNKSALVVKTMNGYHYYLPVLCSTFHKCLARFYKVHKHYDKYHLKIARYRKPPMLVIRIGGKHDNDLRIIKYQETENQCLNNYYNEIIRLIEYLNA